jgi:IQ and AAA domain-containing protein
LGDVREAIRGCLLGLGPQNVAKPKSLCIAGPPQCGKKLLADAICSEVDAVCFDLSAPIIANPKCDLGHFGHLILKMARLLQPTVLFIDGAHKPFYRKIPREEKPLDPR